MQFEQFEQFSTRRGTAFCVGRPIKAAVDRVLIDILCQLVIGARRIK